MTSVFNLEEIFSLASSISPEGMGDIVHNGLKAAVEAGRLARERFGKAHQVSYKGEIDLVTETDLESERIIKEQIKDVGMAEIMAEESSLDSSLRDGTFWIIDPLDGTTNFAHSFPFFGPSVAYCQVKDSVFLPLFGCVFVPCLGELFWAIQGQGSYLNTDRIQVSREQDLTRALLATGFPYDVHQNPEKVISSFKDMLVRAQGIRRAGAAALDLAYVACGRFEGFWEMKLKPWDTAAGQLLVQEAGGRLSDFSGGTYHPFLPEIIASNALIHNDMVKILERYSK